MVPLQTLFPAVLAKKADDGGGQDGPPNYRAGAPAMGPNCASCKHYDKQGGCTKYGVPVQPEAVCDSFEPVEIDVKAIQNAKPVQAIKANLGPAPMDFSGFGGEDMKFGSVQNVVEKSATGPWCSRMRKKRKEKKAMSPLAKLLLAGGGIAGGAGIGALTGYAANDHSQLDPDLQAKENDALVNVVDKGDLEREQAGIANQQMGRNVGHGALMGGTMAGAGAAGFAGGGLLGSLLSKKKAPPAPTEKEGRARRPDQYKNMNDWVARISHHPEASSGSVWAPLKVAYEAMDKEPHPALQVDGEHPQSRLTGKGRTKVATTDKKAAFKRAFLLKCAEDGLSLEETHARIKSAIEKLAQQKKADIAGLAGSGLKTVMDAGLLAAIGIPMVTGVIGGAAYNQLQPRESVDHLKREDLRNEYYRLADSIRRKTQIREMQERDPGSVVRIA